MEFFNDQQRADHLAALAREKEGYEHRKERGKYGRDPLSVDELDDRIKQINDEIARIEGDVSVEETEKAEKTSKPKRGGKKAAAKAGASKAAGSGGGGKEAGDGK